MIILVIALILVGLYATYLHYRLTDEFKMVGHLLGDLYSHGEVLKDIKEELDLLDVIGISHAESVKLGLLSISLDDQADFILDFVLGGESPDE